MVALAFAAERLRGRAHEATDRTAAARTPNAARPAPCSSARRRPPRHAAARGRCSRRARRPSSSCSSRSRSRSPPACARRRRPVRSRSASPSPSPQARSPLGRRLSPGHRLGLGHGLGLRLFRFFRSRECRRIGRVTVSVAAGACLGLRNGLDDRGAVRVGVDSRGSESATVPVPIVSPSPPHEPSARAANSPSSAAAASRAAAIIRSSSLHPSPPTRGIMREHHGRRGYVRLRSISSTR